MLTHSFGPCLGRPPTHPRIHLPIHAHINPSFLRTHKFIHPSIHPCTHPLIHSSKLPLAEHFLCHDIPGNQRSLFNRTQVQYAMVYHQMYGHMAPNLAPEIVQVMTAISLHIGYISCIVWVNSTCTWVCPISISSTRCVLCTGHP